MEKFSFNKLFIKDTNCGYLNVVFLNTEDHNMLYFTGNSFYILNEKTIKLDDYSEVFIKSLDKSYSTVTDIGQDFSNTYFKINDAVLLRIAIVRGDFIHGLFIYEKNSQNGSGYEDFLKRLNESFRNFSIGLDKDYDESEYNYLNEDYEES